MDKGSETHYDEVYFSWQKNVGEFGGWANLTKFEEYIKETDKVVDFGCGGAYLLKNINCAEKIGVELNDVARKAAKETNNIDTVKYVTELQDEYYDVIISNHALEHCNDPYQELLKLQTKLRSGGKIIFVVPFDGVKQAWHPNSKDMHLYSWSPMNLGNLFTVAGFNVLNVHLYKHKWPPNYLKYAKYGRKVFDFACKIYARRTMKILTQTRLIAEKP